MYVCICNPFTCKDVKKVRDQGVSKSGQVYKKLGCSMHCGKFLETIDSLLKEQNDPNPTNNQNVKDYNFFPVNA